MADLKALEILKQGVQRWNNNWNLLNRDLSEADLHRQDLTGARFEATNLADANFRGSILCSAHFEGADLSSARLEGADLSSAVFGKDDRRCESVQRPTARSHPERLRPQQREG